MFENNLWVYYSSLLVAGFGALILNTRKLDYSLADYTVAGQRVKRQRIVSVITFVMIGYVVFWAAIRNGVIDTKAYIANYESLNTDINVIQFFQTQKEPLFAFYQILLKKMGCSWQFFLASVAVISGLGIYKGIKDYSDDVALSYYFFITGLYSFWLFNGIRQFLVATIVFANIRLIVEKKLWKFLLLVFVLYLIHRTAIILIPIYFIANLKNWSYGIYAFVLATMAVVVLFPNQFAQLLDDSFTEYNVTEQFSSDDGVNIFRFLVAMVTPLLAFVYKEKIREVGNPYVNAMVNLSLISAGLYAIGVATSGIYMGRLPLFTDLFCIILLPYLLKRILPKETRNVIWVTSMLFYLLYFYLQMNKYYYTTNIFPSMDMGGAQVYR